MTLVAAYKVDGIPILLGDFLVSTPKEQFRGSKKIARVRNNLAVGWTGSLLYADEVIARMYEDLGSHPTREQIEQWFAHGAAELQIDRALKLVGWHCDGGAPCAFHWDSTAQHLTWGTEWFVGSGGADFESSFIRRADTGAPGNSNPVQRALPTVLSTLTILNCNDRLVREGNEIGIGGGYEALYWSPADARFEYLSDVLYFVACCEMDAEGKVAGPPSLMVETFTTYRGGIGGEYAMLTLSDGQDSVIWAMSAAGQPEMSDELYEKLRSEWHQPMDLSADFYGGLLTFRAAEGVPPAVLVGCPWESRKLFHSDRGQFEFQLGKETVEVIYRKMLAAHTEAQYPLQDIEPA